MLPFLMSAAAQGKKGGLKFNADEISAIIEEMCIRDRLYSLAYIVSLLFSTIISPVYICQLLLSFEY